MKIRELTEDVSREEIAEILKRDCSNWLSDIGNNMAFRGIRSHEIIIKVKQPTHRHPTGTYIQDHKNFIKAFNILGFKANRHNSFFVFGNKRPLYGTNVYGFFPIGNYDFTWSPKVYDLFMIFDSYMVGPNNSIGTFTQIVVNKNRVKMKDEEIIKLLSKMYDIDEYYRFGDELKIYTNNEYKNSEEQSKEEKIIRDILKNDSVFSVSIYYYTKKENNEEYIGKLTDLLKNKYEYRQNDNIREALSSKNEIMISCKEAWMVRYDHIPYDLIGIEYRDEWARANP